MPGMRGPELAREVLAISPETTVLFISGYPDNAVESIESIESGKNFLQKPFTPKQLLLTVKEILA
jgi:two-component system cell cycle sensor histidine kinase/response regulator CckA